MYLKTEHVNLWVDREASYEGVGHDEESICCQMVGTPGLNMRAAACMIRLTDADGFCRKRTCSVGDGLLAKHGRHDILAEREKSRPKPKKKRPPAELCQCGSKAAPALAWKQFAPKTDVPICNKCHLESRLEYLKGRVIETTGDALKCVIDEIKSVNRRLGGLSTISANRKVAK